MAEAPEREPRPYGTGYVETRVGKRGVRYRALFPDRGKHMTLGTFNTYEDAERALNGAVKASRIATVAGAITLRQAGVELLDKLDQMDQRDWSRSYWQHVLAAKFIDWPLDSFVDQQVMLQDWIELDLPKRKKTRVRTVGGRVERELIDETISWQTVLHIRNLVSRIFGRHKKVLPVNPLAGLKLRKPAVQDADDWTYLTAAEVELVERGAHGVSELAQNTFVFAIYTGLREGELCGLRLDHVHLDAPRPYVRVRFSFEAPTKSNRTRTVHLLPKAAAALRRVIELQRKRKNPHGLVWRNADGDMHTNGHDWGWADKREKRAPNGLRRGKKSRLGIERHVVFHALRHTCATHLLTGTWRDVDGEVIQLSLREVQLVLGHTSQKTTERYAQIADSVLARHAGKTPKMPPSSSGGGDGGGGASSKKPNDGASLDGGVPGGTRTHDHQLRRLSGGAEVSSTSADLGAVWEGSGSAVALARRLTLQIARQEQVTEAQGLELAAAVLSSAPVQLAGAVLAAPPEFRAARVLDLVELLCPGSGAAAHDLTPGVQATEDV